MLQKLPVSDFRYLSEKEVADFDLTGESWQLDGEKGYVIKCDIGYPKVKNALAIVPMFILN